MLSIHSIDGSNPVAAQLQQRALPLAAKHPAYLVKSFLGRIVVTKTTVGPCWVATGQWWPTAPRGGGLPGEARLNTLYSRVAAAAMGSRMNPECKIYIGGLPDDANK